MTVLEFNLNNKDYIEDLLTRSTYHSNAIEGSTLTYAETYAILYNDNSFKIEGKDHKVSMYNIALTEEQIKNGVNNNPNITSNETTVENTSSFTSIIPYLISAVCILLGGTFLYKIQQEN